MSSRGGMQLSSREGMQLSSREGMQMSSRTSAASVGIYYPGTGARYSAVKVDPDTRGPAGRSCGMTGIAG
jgi:hypothetical protein